MKHDLTSVDWKIFEERLCAMEVGQTLDAPEKWFRVLRYKDCYWCMWHNPVKDRLGIILNSPTEIMQNLNRSVWTGTEITY